MPKLKEGDEVEVTMRAIVVSLNQAALGCDREDHALIEIQVLGSATTQKFLVHPEKCEKIEG
jgi:hypothetical protein